MSEENKQKLYCDNCPEMQKTRCLERKEKYKQGYEWLENRITDKEILKQVKALKIYPTRCDYVLEQQLQAKEKELKKASEIAIKYTLEWQKEKQRANDLEIEISEIRTGVNGVNIPTLYGNPLEYYLQLKKENEKIKIENEKLKKLAIRACILLEMVELDMGV